MEREGQLRTAFVVKSIQGVRVTATCRPREFEPTGLAGPEPKMLFRPLIQAANHKLRVQRRRATTVSTRLEQNDRGDRTSSFHSVGIRRNLIQAIEFRKVDAVLFLVA
jgi:hypothetical protein